jgi:hypothetical protein
LPSTTQGIVTASDVGRVEHAASAALRAIRQAKLCKVTEGRVLKGLLRGNSPGIASSPLWPGSTDLKFV